MKLAKDCVICGKHFWTNRKRQKLCSFECRQEYDRKKAGTGPGYKLTCAVCGKEFNNPLAKTKTCSRECKKALGSGRIESISSKAWLVLIEYAKEACGYKCSKCGSDEDLHCHHITPKESGGSDDPTNLTILCRNCHIGVHREITRAFVEASSAPTRQNLL